MREKGGRLSSVKTSVSGTTGRPERSEVEAAFRTIIRWTGDDPDRDGLRESPARAARAFEEFFQGYRQDPEDILRKTFEETDGYDEMIVLRGIRFESHCEHHIAPIIGRVSMDLMAADVTDLDEVPEALDILGAHQGVDALATAAGTIGYEVLTALGARYARRYNEAAA